MNLVQICILDFKLSSKSSRILLSRTCSSCHVLRRYHPSCRLGNCHNKYLRTSLPQRKPNVLLFNCNPFTSYSDKWILHHAQMRFLPITARLLHTTPLRFDKSKVEDSLKEKIKQQETSVAAEDPLTSSKEDGAAASKVQEATPAKKPLWQRVKAEILHYYHGFRLLGLDIRIASKSLWKLLRGKQITRRESNQFKRAVSDIFRLAPFSIFIIIPFAEVALPFVVRIFPRLLPSTFEDESSREARLKQELTVKLKMAKFMQDAVEEIAMRSKKSSQHNQATENFSNFLQKIRTTDEEPTNSEILKHAKLFEDELTLDSMTRPQLVALCRLIQVPAVGSNNLLRFLLQLKLRRLHADDETIQREGIDTLTVQELQTACQARGMRALGMSKARLRQQLQQWIDLHLNHDIPSSLLLLSRVLFMPENVPVEKRVKEAISSLPEKLAHEAEVRAAEINCERVDNTKKYMSRKQEQIDIDKEEAEERKRDEERKIQEEQETKKRKQQEESKIAETVQMAEAEYTVEPSKEQLQVDPAPVLSDKAPDLEESVTESVLVDKAAILKEEITKEDIDALDKAIGTIKKEDTLEQAKSELEDLKEDVVEYQQDVESLEKNLADEEDEISTKEKKVRSRLQSRITKVIGKLELIVEELEKADKSPGSGDKESERSISVEHLKQALGRFSEFSEDSASRLASLLDANEDGHIDLDEVVVALKTLDSEDVSVVTKEQLHQLLCLIQDITEEKVIEKS